MNIGDKLPEVLGLNQDGKEIRTSDFAGKKLILYPAPIASAPAEKSEVSSCQVTTILSVVLIEVFRFTTPVFSL